MYSPQSREHQLKAVLKYSAVAATTLAMCWSVQAAGALRGKNVVLVHGAFSDGSSWEKVIPLLEEKGLHVVSVQNPLSSLKDDVAATERAIQQQNGPVILVGHSWGGVVISQAGADEKVKALVYVAAFAPDRGQSINDIFKGLPEPSWVHALEKDSAGFLKLSTEAVMHDFAQDLPEPRARLIAITQGPWFSGCIEEKITTAAWHDKPSWMVVAEKDHIIAPSLQTKMAKDIHASVVSADGSHAVMLSKPERVAAAIVAAAEAVK
jgi:pimeloyl-ACP methyl ester carboxylesterase